MDTDTTFLDRSRVGVHLRSTDWDRNLAGDRQRLHLVFLHFFGGSSRSWEPVMELLAGEFPCHALDLRGFGQTRVPEETSGEVST